MFFNFFKRQVIRQVFDSKILVLNFHCGTNVDLNSKYAFERASVPVKID